TTSAGNERSRELEPGIDQWPNWPTGRRTRRTTRWSASGGYRCTECGQKFTDRLLVYQHMRIVHSSDQFHSWTLTPTVMVTNSTSRPFSQPVNQTYHKQTPDALPPVPTIATTSSADNQLVNITTDTDSDSDIVLIGRVPAPKRPARNRSPVDIKPSLIDSIPLVPEIVNKPPVETVTLTRSGRELVRELAPGIRRVKRRTPSPPVLWCSHCELGFETRDTYFAHMRPLHWSAQARAEALDSVAQPRVRALHSSAQPTARAFYRSAQPKARSVPCDECERYFYDNNGLKMHKMAKHYK
ncbi:unnamed protein product, partial [Medioppia subpectinata]